MLIITNLSEQLRRDEGEKLQLYKDTVGKWTIGVGRNLSDDGISPDESDLMLANDIKHASVALEANFPWALDLDDVRQGAMLNLIFNLGTRGLSEFHNFLAAMQRKDYATAKAELFDSEAYQQEPARIARLGLQLESGYWQ